MGLTNEQVHDLTVSVILRKKMTGESLFEAFGYVFRHSPLNEHAIYHQTRLAVKDHLSYLKALAKKQDSPSPVQKDLFKYSPIPQVQYPD